MDNFAGSFSEKAAKAEIERLRAKLEEKGRAFDETLLMQGEEITRLRARVRTLEELLRRAEPVEAPLKAEVERLRAALKEILDHVEMQNCDVIGAIQEARAALRGGE